MIFFLFVWLLFPGIGSLENCKEDIGIIRTASSENGEPKVSILDQNCKKNAPETGKTGNIGKNNFFFTSNQKQFKYCENAT